MGSANRLGSNSALDSGRRLVAAVSVLIGLYLAAFGNAWAPMVLEWLSGSRVGAWVELIVPFLPMAFIGLGAFLFVPRRYRD